MRLDVLMIASYLRLTLAFVSRQTRPSQSLQFYQNSRSYAWSTTRLAALSKEDDERFMNLAIDAARSGLTRTFPNPAVGCVLVREDTKEIIGQGFHPRAGYPHAEVFALLQAANHVKDGVALAKAVVDRKDSKLLKQAETLTQKYASDDGPKNMFENCLLIDNEPMVTAYVTLEPCSHHGRTPPCAVTLALAKPHRVVVGFRDPNPKVDGGGVKLLQEAGIEVRTAQGRLQKACGNLVTNFCKRITPRPDIAGYEYVNGAMRSALRALASRRKQDGTMAKVAWGGKSVSLEFDYDGDDEEVEGEQNKAIDELDLPAEWMEHVDTVLWKQELVVLQLNKAINRKKLVKRLGERIADELQAHVAQTVGHTVLLYRPGIPAKLNLEALVAEKSQSKRST